MRSYKPHQLALLLSAGVAVVSHPGSWLIAQLAKTLGMRLVFLQKFFSVGATLQDVKVCFNRAVVAPVETEELF